MASRCTNDGQMYLDVTFEVGTDLDMAQVLVQNRVSIAEAKLPEEVKRHWRDHEEEIAQHPAVRQPDLREKARRKFLLRSALPEQLSPRSASKTTWPASRAWATWPSSGRATTACASGSIRRSSRPCGMTAGDVIKAIREQNVQVAAGRLGQPPVAAGDEPCRSNSSSNAGPPRERRAVRQHHRQDRVEGRSRQAARRRAQGPTRRARAESSRRARSWGPRTTTSTATSTAIRRSRWPSSSCRDRTP